jgi:tetratricopeptide (TPR) repeat protein
LDPSLADLAIQSFEEAIKLEETNPYYYTELGKIYLIKNKISKARELFQKSIDLKPDYSPGHFQMAMSFVQEGKIGEGIARLEVLKGNLPNDPGLAFQLGLLYYNQNDFEKAKTEFERAVNLLSNYSNARYFLGLIYDREGKKDLAIKQFEEIEKFNPENQEIKKILENLRQGKSALEGILPSQPPIEEKVPEKLTPSH